MVHLSRTGGYGGKFFSNSWTPRAVSYFKYFFYVVIFLKLFCKYSYIFTTWTCVKFTVKLHNPRLAKCPNNLQWLCRFLRRPSATDYTILIIFLWPKRQLGLSARIMRAFTNFISHSLPFLPFVLWGLGPWVRIVLQGVLWFRFGINFAFWMLNEKFT